MSPQEARVRLWLMRLASPSLPVGGFSYSEGLESAVHAGLVHNADSATGWLRAQLHTVLVRAELPLLQLAHRAWQCDDQPRVQALNHWLMCTRETLESRRQTEQMGRSLTVWLQHSEHAGDPRLDALAALPPAPGWPTAFALAAVVGEAAPADTLLSYGMAWAENQVQAALKAVPLGQRAGQQVLAALLADLPSAVQQAGNVPEDGLYSFAPALAVLSARHETQYSRLFRS